MREISRVLTVLGLLTVSFATNSGCSGHPPYPRTWPPLRPVSRQSCERVAGSYLNQGERGQMEHAGSVYLTEMLFNAPRTTGAETVTLSFSGSDQLDVVISSTEPIPRRLSFSRKAGQFKCDGSTLVLKMNPAKWFSVSAGAPAVGGSSVVMKADSVEGYLIVTRRDKDFLWLPFPGWSTWSSWYRFRRVPAGTVTKPFHPDEPPHLRMQPTRHASLGGARLIRQR